MAHVCGLRAGELIHMMGDTHVYLNHVEPLKEQIARTPTSFPKLVIKRPITDIGNWTFDDLDVVGYKPQGPIKMDMAV
jgi:thymidylate synthase